MKIFALLLKSLIVASYRPLKNYVSMLHSQIQTVRTQCVFVFVFQSALQSSPWGLMQALEQQVGELRIDTDDSSYDAAQGETADSRPSSGAFHSSKSLLSSLNDNNVWGREHVFFIQFFAPYIGTYVISLACPQRLCNLFLLLLFLHAPVACNFVLWSICAMW